MMIFITHLMGCFWFLAAKFQDFAPDTWVYEKDIVNEDPGIQYLISFYWAFQTLTTVGYGDINANGNMTEQILAFIWMLIGVAVQSNGIGTIISVIQASDQDSEEINEKI
jgi:hypothetical protein